MSEAEANRFIEDMQSIPNMAEEFVKLKDRPTEVYELVRARDYDATQAEIREAFFEHSSKSLTEEQVREIAAGLSTGGKVGIGVAGLAVSGAVGATAAVSAVGIVGFCLMGSAAAAL